ncbi:hypothetical protein PR002_g30284, partial [Phytophthora rubi]
MSPPPPRIRRAACVAAVMGGVSLHGVASATNIESACWPSASSTTNLLYYTEMSPSSPRVRRAACVAKSMGERSLHGVPPQTSGPRAGHPPAAPQTRCTASKLSPLPPVRPHSCLRRQINGRSESPRR